MSMNISSVQTYMPTLQEPRNTDRQEHALEEEGIKSSGTKDEKASKSDAELSSSEKQQLVELQQRDAEVRSHEAAHIAAGGAAVSGAASFTYQKGPDGKLYAVGGEVSISSSGGNSPEEKIALARQIQAGALAPANPSPQDLKVASSAALMEAQARQELALEKSEEQKEKEVNSYQDSQDETKTNSSQGYKLSLQA